jgi:hypothetical protein
MHHFIESNDIYYSQILSLTMNETKLTDGDSMLTFFYRDAPTGHIANDFLLTKGNFHDIHFSEKSANYGRARTWSQLVNVAQNEKEAEGNNVISLVHSPHDVHKKD